MRVLTFILCFACSICSGQIMRSPFYKANSVVEKVTFETEYQTVYDAMTNKPSTDIANAQNTLVKELKAAGVWTLMDVFYCFAQESNVAGEALLNWREPAGDDNATNSSGTTFTSLEGFTGNGSSYYLNTNFTPSSEGANITLNSASIGAYVRTNVDEAKYIVGSSTNILMMPKNGGAFYGRISGSSNVYFAQTTSAGFHVLTRPSSTTLSYFNNGTDKGDNTVNSTTLSTSIVYLIGSSSLSSFSSQQLSIFFIGANMTNTQITNMNTAIEKYMDAIGKGVE